MKYDFTSIIDRKGKDALAVDILPNMLGPGKKVEVREGLDYIPMWVADMNFPALPKITEAIIERAKHPTYGYFITRDEYYNSIIKWHEERNHVTGLKKEHIGYENGVLGGVASALHAVCSQGDNVLVHAPTYIGFTGTLNNNGYHIIHSPLKKDEEGIWRMDFEDMEEKIVKNKIHAAIFCSPHNPTGRVWERWEIEKAMEIYKKYDVTVTALWCGWGGPSAWNFYAGQETLGLVPVAYRYARMQDLTDGSDFAKRLGVTDVVTHMGFVPENPNDANYPGFVAAVRSVAAHMQANGQYLLFETGQETPVTLRRLFEDVGLPNLAVNLDPANLILYGKANPVDALEVIGKYVRGVHGKDGCYPTNGHDLGVETPMGQGRVDFPALLKGLHALGYDGCITIEREIEGDQQAVDILAARDMLQGILAAL